MSAAAIRLAEDDAAVARCHAVMVHLRHHLASEAFVAQVRRQCADGYRLAYLEADGAVRACAGFRVAENLVYGRYLYVDDLVTEPEARSAGFGGQLMEWLVARARSEGCAILHLDSGVQRFAAHRFYLRHRMEITAHHLTLKL